MNIYEKLNKAKLGIAKRWVEKVRQKETIYKYEYFELV